MSLHLRDDTQTGDLGGFRVIRQRQGASRAGFESGNGAISDGLPVKTGLRQLELFHFGQRRIGDFPIGACRRDIRRQFIQKLGDGWQLRR